MIKVGLFIDGFWTYYCQKEQGWDIDFGDVLNFFTNNREVCRALYFCGSPPPQLPSDARRKYSKFKIDLGNAGYEIIETTGQMTINGRTGSPVPHSQSLEDSICSKLNEEIGCYDLAVLFSVGKSYEKLAPDLRQKRKWLLVVAPANVHRNTGADPVIFVNIDDIRNDIEFVRGRPPHGSRSESLARGILQLHPRIIKNSYTLYIAGSYAKAVECAYNAVDIYLQEVTDVSAQGLNLIERAFTKENPIIRLNPLANRKETDEQEGFKHLFLGVWLLRCAIAHEGITHMDQGTALKHLSLASLIIERLEAPGVVVGGAN